MSLPNVFIDNLFHEMDFMGLRRSGYLDEIEIKLTASDFKADFNKTVKVARLSGDKKPHEWWTSYDTKLKHECLPKGLNHCNYFYFCIPEELVGKCEVPEYAGLLVVCQSDDWGISIREDKKPNLLHKRKIESRLINKVLVKSHYRYWNLLYDNNEIHSR